MSRWFITGSQPILHISKNKAGLEAARGEDKMKSTHIKRCLMVGVAGLSLMSTSAFAATEKEKQLEARIEALERAFGTMQGELQTTRSENVQLREAVSRAETKASEATSVATAAAAK
ncbi:hypothetical protein, partial [Sphingorhabdus sp.]|uniref:hypothetical protein n=1 Tax=Sphingorhabdus sp. TaxID=1902408 RepID=UPI003BAECC42